MSSDPLDDLRADASANAASKATSWILWLLHPKVAIPLVLILFLFSAPLVYRAIRLAKVPPADEPFDTKTVLEFVVPDADNAFVEYRAASGLLVPRDPKAAIEEFDKTQSDGWGHATEPVRKWLAANRPFMELWRKGTAKPDAQNCRASELRADTSLTNEIQEAREFSRLVRLESSRLLVEGQPDEAWDWLQTSFRMSRQFGRHGPMIERLVGIGTHSLTSEGMVRWANDSQVTADLLRRAMREIQDEQKRSPPLSACLQTEYLSVMATWRTLPWCPGTPEILSLTGESELNERVFRHLYTEWLARANERDKRFRRDQQGPDPTLLKPRPSSTELNTYVSHSVLSSLLVPSVSQLFVATDREAARDSVLLTVLALELFAREHGHYPEKLEELVPDFLPAVPEDTHAPPKTPLRYRRDGDEALIYSVGDNGTDDGGMFEKAEDIGYRIGGPKK